MHKFNIKIYTKTITISYEIFALSIIAAQKEVEKIFNIKNNKYKGQKIKHIYINY